MIEVDEVLARSTYKVVHPHPHEHQRPTSAHNLIILSSVPPYVIEGIVLHYLLYVYDNLQIFLISLIMEYICK